MIIKIDNPIKKREARIRLYKDDVFVIAYEAINEMNTSLSVEELFCTADNLTCFLLSNDLDDRDMLQAEVNALKEELSDDMSSFLVLSLTYIKLGALRKTNNNAEKIARSLVLFCQKYQEFNDFLKNLFKKEQSRKLEGKRVDLLTYELRSIENISQDSGAEIMKNIVDVTLGFSVDAMQHIENAISETNDKLNHRYDYELQRLREARKKKSETLFHIEKLNDIHHNSKVNFGFQKD